MIVSVVLCCLLSDAVNEACTFDESKAVLMEYCDALPEEGCYNGTDMDEKRGCGEHEFDCGDGTCAHGTSLCDYRFDCSNGADELGW